MIANISLVLDCAAFSVSSSRGCYLYSADNLNKRKIPEKYGVTSVIVRDCDFHDETTDNPPTHDYTISVTTEAVVITAQNKVADMHKVFRSGSQSKKQEPVAASEFKEIAMKDKKIAGGNIQDQPGDFTADDFDKLFSEKQFKPKCDDHPEQLGLRQGKEKQFLTTQNLNYFSGGSFDGPTPIGGFCFGQKDKKDCGMKCIPKTEACNGTCSYDQCLRNNKCEPLLNAER